MSKKILQRINQEEFLDLFVGELYWSAPRGIQNRPINSEITGETYLLKPVGEYKGLTAWVCNDLPKRAVRTEIANTLSKMHFDYVLVFTDGANQVWTWPSVKETRLSFRRLTAQHHRVGDKNDALARRLDRFMVDVQREVSAADLLVSVQKGFDTDTEAALRIADLHSKLLEIGMDGTAIEVFLTRLLFLFFGEDTDLFAQGPYDAAVAFKGDIAGGDEFRNLIIQFRDGVGFREVILDLFEALKTPMAERRDLSPLVADFPYVNGGLFADVKAVPEFDEELTSLVLACSDLDWSDISPAIFGSMFEGLLESTISHVVNAADGHVATRRQLGAHYTSEENILRVIKPLFLDQLHAELNEAGQDGPKLRSLHDKICSLTFFDPACGCGNFLVVTYKELRELENVIIERLVNAGALAVDEIPNAMNLRIDQFFGIEISVSASQVAQVALWITDHQMNVETFNIFGRVRHSIPLSETPGIVRADALTHPWDEVISAKDCDFIVGNPPYLGKRYQSRTQKDALKTALLAANGGPDPIERPGSLDFIAGWFVKATDFIVSSQSSGQIPIFEMQESEEVWGKNTHSKHVIRPELAGVHNPHGTRVALVSTNSICQGEQVSAMWPWVFGQGLNIQFAHQTFKWSNSSPGAANVFCVVIGLGTEQMSECTLYTYTSALETVPEVQIVHSISPYLTPGGQLAVKPSSVPLTTARPMAYGNMPIDGGKLILSSTERDMLLERAPEAIDYVRRLVAAEDFLHDKYRYCLWFENMTLTEVRELGWPNSYIDDVQKSRLQSDSKTTRDLASTPHLFASIRQPDVSYLLIPRVSSEDRPYIPIGFVSPEVIATDATFTVSGANMLDFSVLMSSMHHAWMRFTSGRLKGDYRYSNKLTYNTFPWPDFLEETPESLAEFATKVLGIRSANADMTLAQLYSSRTMPGNLKIAHEELDAAVDKAFGYVGDGSDESRLEFLLPLYEALIKPNR